MIWYNIKVNGGSMSFRIERLCPVNFRPVTVASCLVFVSAAPSYAQGSSSNVQSKDETPAVVAEPSIPSVEQGRSDENAIRTAEDAFGTSIGRETIGLYSSQNIRGFSPISAGNARIEGLYFDQIYRASCRSRH